MQIEFSMVLSILSVSAALFFGFHAFNRTNSKDVEETASMNARVLTKLDAISDDIREMKSTSKDLRNDINRLNERVLRLETKYEIPLDDGK